MRPIYPIFFCALVLAGCGGGNSGGSTKAESAAQAKATPPSEPITSRLDERGTTLLMATVSQYYSLKNALVATRPKDADDAARGLAGIADSFKFYLLSDSANKTALQPFLDTIINQSNVTAAVTDESCERKRLAFGTISSALYGLLKKAELKNGGIYHEYCPMAFNEKGAYWLSNETDIKNPYFGKKMLECGEVEDSL